MDVQIPNVLSVDYSSIKSLNSRASFSIGPAVSFVDSSGVGGNGGFDSAPTP